MTRTVATLLLALLPACETRDIVVAEVGGSSEGGGSSGGGGLGGGGGGGIPSGPEGSPCHTNEDCAPNEYCALSDCAEPEGRCQWAVQDCTDEGQPTCGCDGVTYWNDCLRKRQGVSASKPGPCDGDRDGAKCSDPNGADCPATNASCSLVLRLDAACPTTKLLGACWVLPQTCPPPAPGMPWFVSCTGEPGCVDYCSAIQSGQALRPAPPDACRP